MPHLRERHCLNTFKKKIAFSPVVAVQGARQTGKSVLVRDLLSRQVDNLEFRSFDSPNLRKFATSNPESFLAQFGENKLVAIDEAQKVSDIFDAVKLRVDVCRRPGMYVLLGSSQFSTLSGIRESLTGRMSRLRIFPFTLAETGKLELSASRSPIFVSEKPRCSRHELMQYLNRGGLPGVFSVRSEQERASLLEDWLSLTCERDLLQLKIKNLSPDIARRVLETIPKLMEPTANNIAHYIGMDSRKVFKHLSALESLFVVTPLPAHQAGRGKHYFFLFDVGLADFFGAPFEVKLFTFALNEILSRISYRGLLHHKLHYYCGRRGGVVHFVLENREKLYAIKLLSQESLDLRDLQVLFAWKRKDPKVELFALGSDRISLKKEKTEIYPWESLG